MQLGPVRIPLDAENQSPKEEQRVQVLFRPEDVVLAAQPEVLAVPQLGYGVVEQTVFSGSFERLRLRLPPFPGVRPSHRPWLLAMIRSWSRRHVSKKR